MFSTLRWYIVLGLAGGVGAVGGLRASADEPDSRPNIVFILMDDLRWDDLGCTGHPFVQTPNVDRVAREGALFRNAFAVTPLCSPSRASFLTGLYPHTHGIVDNTERSPRSHELVTFPRLLHDAGYETAFVGKWHMGLDDSPRPGFDHWVCVKGQGSYLDPTLNVDGQQRAVTGYVTDLFNDYAEAFVRRPHERPFLLYVSHKAMHPDLTQNADGSISDPSAGEFVPAERHRGLYADAKITRRPNAASSPSGQPALSRDLPGLPPLGPDTGTSDETIRNRLRLLAAADEGLGDLLTALEQTGQLQRTLLVFTSDHGYFYGEHGLSVERRLAYEEAIRIPLVIRWPGRVRPGSTFDEMVLSVDLAPTMLEAGGAAVPPSLHGRSLVPLFDGTATGWRNSLLIEHASDNVFPRVAGLGYQAVRTDGFKHIHYLDQQGMDELYDLTADPYEMHNLIDQPDSRPTLVRLQAELERLRRETP